MKAAFIQKTGPADVIIFGDFPEPVPTGRQVLVRVCAVSVNPIDTYIRAGAVAMPLPFPYIIGCDVAGVVQAIGPTVTRYKIGDRVWGSNQGLMGRQGTFAEKVAVDEEWLYPIPDGVSEVDAAAIALVGITAHLGIARHARLQAGETLFINGGSGGVGSAVIQMAKAIGARVIATAGSEANVARCRALGADDVFNYKTDDVDTHLQRVAPKGIDVWWETQREPNFERAVPLLARRGRIILMAGREARPTFPVGPFYTKDCSLHGFAMFNATAEEQAESAAVINRWLSEGKLKAHIGQRLPLAQAVAAHRLQEESTLHKSGALCGKIVLEP